MKFYKYKQYFFIFLFVLFLFVTTQIHEYYIEHNDNQIDINVVNDLQQKIDNNDYDDINYEYLNKNLTDVDSVLKYILNKTKMHSKKTFYYKQASNIYQNKINEIVSLLNLKLNEDDFKILMEDLETFYKEIDNAENEIDVVNDSSTETEYYINKYNYEEKQKKCHELIETYKGFFS